MGNQLGVAQQQWSPSSEPMRDVPLERRPRRIVVECAVREHGTQQLLRYETRDADVLERAVALYNDTKYSLRWQWVRKRERRAHRERDVLVVWIYTSAHRHRCYRIGPRTLQEIDVGSSSDVREKSGTDDDGAGTYTLFDWLSDTAAKYAHYEAVWLYETEEDATWPVHAFFHTLCFHSATRVRVPLVVNVRSSPAPLLSTPQGSAVSEHRACPPCRTRTIGGGVDDDLAHSASCSAARPHRATAVAAREHRSQVEQPPASGHVMIASAHTSSPGNVDHTARLCNDSTLPTGILSHSHNHTVAGGGGGCSRRRSEQTLLWTLVYKARDGYADTVQHLRSRIHGVPPQEQQAATTRARTHRMSVAADAPGAAGASAAVRRRAEARRRTASAEGGCSGSVDDDDGDDDTDNVQALHDRLVQYLDFDDPWVQTGAMRVDPDDESCVEHLIEQLRAQFGYDEATDAELEAFARRRLVQLSEAQHHFLPNSFADRACPGLALPGTGATSPFDCYAQVVARHPLVPRALREQAMRYHPPVDHIVVSCPLPPPPAMPPPPMPLPPPAPRGSDAHNTTMTEKRLAGGGGQEEGSAADAQTTTRAASGRRHSAGKSNLPVALPTASSSGGGSRRQSQMVAYGERLLAIVDEYCVDHMIPRRRLASAFDAYRAAIGCARGEQDDKRDKREECGERVPVDRALLSLYFLRRAGAWLVFWGERGYGFAPRLV